MAYIEVHVDLDEFGTKDIVRELTVRAKAEDLDLRDDVRDALINAEPREKVSTAFHTPQAVEARESIGRYLGGDLCLDDALRLEQAILSAGV